MDKPKASALVRSLQGILIVQALLLLLGIALLAGTALYPYLFWKEKFTLLIAGTGSLAFSAATLGGLLTLIASVAPRWLSAVGFGPCLILDWKLDSAYVHQWDRHLPAHLTRPAEKKKSEAVIVRLAVKNEGEIGAEAVEVILEYIAISTGEGMEKPYASAKFEPLRWAGSYDLKEFENLDRHRCSTIYENLIHAGSTQFVDFGFIFASGSPFYSRGMTTRDALEPGYWEFHPFYQWLPAHDNAVLKPANTYNVHLALAAKNSHTQRYVVQVRCAEVGAIKTSVSSDVVGMLLASQEATGRTDAQLPVEIRILSKREFEDIRSLPETAI